MILRQLCRYFALTTLLLAAIPLAARARDVSSCSLLFEVPLKSGNMKPKLKVEAALDTIERLRGESGVSIKDLALNPKAPLHRIDIAPIPSDHRPMRVFLAAGVHGNEPIAVVTALRFVEKVLRTPELRQRYALTVIPMLNVAGLRKGSRRDTQKLDINRSFREGAWTQTSALLRDSLGRETFDIAVDLHGAVKRNAFFIVRGAVDRGIAERALQVIPTALRRPSDSGTYPDFSSIDGFPQRYRMELPGLATTQTPGTLKAFMLERGTPLSYVLEYPGRIPRELQEHMLLQLLESLLAEASKG